MLTHRFSWKRLSLAGGLAFHSRRRTARLYLHTHPGAYTDEVLIEFLRDLGDEMAGDKVTLLWDGLGSHWSRRMRRFVATQRRWLVVERLPAYAPELNPVEGLWSSLKSRDLANHCCDTIDQMADATVQGIDRIGRTPDLVFSFLRKARLELYDCH